MNFECKLSNVAQNYIDTFYCILDKMINDMTSACLSDSISHNFIVQMIPHHQAAIEMSKSILKYTTCIPVQEIASRIISEQTKSIQNMQEIKECCSRLTNSEEDLCRYQRAIDQIMSSMFYEMENAKTTNQINCNFMQEMIPHHMGAVRMSDTTLKYCICPELRPILESIYTSQRRGIKQMSCLLHRFNC